MQSVLFFFFNQSDLINVIVSNCIYLLKMVECIYLIVRVSLSLYVLWQIRFSYLFLRHNYATIDIYVCISNRFYM